MSEQYTNLTRYHIYHIANACCGFALPKASSKRFIIDLMNDESFFSSYKNDLDKFNRICAKADEEIGKLRDAEWEALNRIIYEDE